ncbi:MAG: hypothetical protein EP344_13795 [Bacteroidetes bacterium]|nr:MAG: hypothetical protein EP344_13795 [Bacteroidota bacterium]
MIGKSSKFVQKKTGSMKTFRTTLPAFHAPFGISHADPGLLIGSCFTEHIGTQLHERKFPVLANPTGILYNPVSIARTLEMLRTVPSGKPDFFELDGLWHSWDFHGSFSHPDRETAEQQIRSALETAARQVQHARYLVLTLGTAQVSVLKKSGQVVANNHKAPAAWFDQRRLGVSETTEVLATELEALHRALPQLQVVLTVSPVRHLRNGLVENQRSKATLLLACEALCAQLDFACYFPAFELLMDDLRDYRFYTSDLLHPNELAISYIWDYFSNAFFSKETRQLSEQIERIVAAARHRPFHPGTPEHRTFARRQLEQIGTLSRTHPYLDFSREIARFDQFSA